MNQVYKKIYECLYRYLQTHSFTRIACLSNALPCRHEQKYLLNSLNYLCFSAEGLFRKSEVLFLLALCGYRNVGVDVLNASLQACFTKRQFGYLNIVCRNNNEVHSIISDVSKNRQAINQRYPILTRIRSSEPIKITLPGNAIVESALTTEDWIIKIS